VFELWYFEGMQTPKYIITLADPEQLPGLIKRGFLMGHAEARVAFVGRSNVGKSSLINALMEERVARVSATPGKTRAIHFFLWAKANRIVADLPGYGFAKVAKKEQAEWSRLMDAYFKADDAVEVVFMLFDSRHGPTPSDLDALEFFISKDIPVQVVMTKFDQLKTQSERAKRKREVAQALEPYDIGAEELVWLSLFDQRSIESFRRLFSK
jgi:GTP-binding protein